MQPTADKSMCTKVYNPCWWRGTWFEKTHIYWERWKPAWLIDETSGIVYGFLTGLKIAILKKNNGMDGKYRKWLDLDEKKNEKCTICLEGIWV